MKERQQAVPRSGSRKYMIPCFNNRSCYHQFLAHSILQEQWTDQCNKDGNATSWSKRESSLWILSGSGLSTERAKRDPAQYERWLSALWFGLRQHLAHPLSQVPEQLLLGAKPLWSTLK